MAEKTTLAQKNPPIENFQQTTAVDENSHSSISTLTEQPLSEGHEVTITKLESYASHAFLVNTVMMGVIGFLYAVRAVKSAKSIHFKVCVGLSCFANGLALYYFVINGMYTGGLWEQDSGVSLALRGFAWVVFGPSLFVVLAKLDYLRLEKRYKLYLSVGATIVIFACIATGQLSVIESHLQLVLTGIAVVCAVALTMSAFAYLMELDDDLDDNFIKGFQITAIAIACCWLSYPVIYMASLFINNSALCHLLINVVDFAMLLNVAYGMHVCMTFKVKTVVAPTGKRLQKPKMKIPLSKPPGRDAKKKKPMVRSLVD